MTMLKQGGYDAMSVNEQTAVNEPSDASRATRKKVKHGIIDCDVHPIPKSMDQIRQYLPKFWKERFRGGGRGLFYGNPSHGMRQDSLPPDGGPAGSDPGFMRKQLLEANNIKTAILIPRENSCQFPDLDYGNAIASAYNEWIADTWIGPGDNHDGIFKSSIVINHSDPVSAAKEIDRWAGHKHFIQVTTDSGARFLMGHRNFHPIFEACSRHHLPLALHPGLDGIGINILPSPGNPSHYIEWHTCMSLSFQAHLVSLLTEGTFERFPDLRVVLVEGSSTWLVPLMWRLDMEYKALRHEIPWVKKMPSEYLRDHVRITSQPLERPSNDEDFMDMLRMMDAEHLLMFSSDYPHWDFDNPKSAFPKLPEKLYNRIFFENAEEFYGL